MVDLRKSQMEAVNKLRNGNILVGGVGSGKSRTGLAWWYFKECRGALPVNGIGKTISMKTPKDLFIITTPRKRDELEWEGELVPFRISPNGKHNPQGVRVTIDSWNNIKKYIGCKNAVFLFDEQRVVGYGTWARSFLKICKNNQWILLSATPGDKWDDYIPVFIANGFYKNKTEFLRKHAVFNRYAKYPKIDRFTEENILLGYRNRILVKMDVDRQTVRHDHIVWVDYNADLVKTTITRNRWNPYKNEPIQDVSQYCAVLKKAIFSDGSRLEAVSKITLERERTIIFYSFDFELENLRKLKKMWNKQGYSYAEWNGHLHQPIPDSDCWVYLVQYTSGAEAWNCTKTDTIIFYSQNYSYRTMEQARGRIDRINTKYRDLHYYILKSHSGLDNQIAKALSRKKKFNEAKYFGRMFE